MIRLAHTLRTARAHMITVILGIAVKCAASALEFRDDMPRGVSLVMAVIMMTTSLAFMCAIMLTYVSLTIT